jgi:hypothetical protein
MPNILSFQKGRQAENRAVTNEHRSRKLNMRLTTCWNINTMPKETIVHLKRVKAELGQDHSS